MKDRAKGQILVRSLFAGCGLLALCFLAAMYSGCDTNSGDNVSPTLTALTVTPSTVTLTAGQENVIALVASGGNSNYTWVVSTGELGRIKPTDNSSTAIYKSTTNAGVNVVEVLDSANGVATVTITQR